MIFGKSKRKDFNEQIIIDSIPIDEKPEVKYLGVHIDGNLTFHEEVKHPTKNGSRNKDNLCYQEINSIKTFDTCLKCSGIKSLALLSTYHSRN